MAYQTSYEANLSNLKLEISECERVWTIQIQRPDRRNAVDRSTAHALSIVFASFDADQKACVAVLTGSGGHFCSGADLKLVAAGQLNDVLPVESADGPMGPTRMQLSKPVIAAIEGSCVAGGLELACWADLRVASRTAQFGVFCRRWGVPLIDGGTMRLPRLIGTSRAMDMILTGRAVDAEEAFQYGLVNRLASPGKALEHAQSVAFQLAEFPQLCMRNDRLAAIKSYDLPYEKALQTEYDFGVLSMKHARQGAAQFAAGEGRHGSFHTAFAEATSSDLKDSDKNKEFDAVLFDLGGVLLGSPFYMLEKFQREKNVSVKDMGRIFSGNDGGIFGALERGEIDSTEFASKFAAITSMAPADGNYLLECITEGLKKNDLMFQALWQLKAQGYKTGVITNNFLINKNDMPSTFDKVTELMQELDACTACIVESSKEGLRKPNPLIFETALKRIGSHPNKTIFLDDIGKNLKAAANMGIKTIRVRPQYAGIEAISALDKILGTRLVSTVLRATTRRALL